MEEPILNSHNKAEYEPAHTCDVSEMWDSHFSDSGEAKLLITRRPLSATSFDVCTP